MSPSPALGPAADQEELRAQLLPLLHHAKLHYLIQTWQGSSKDYVEEYTLKMMSMILHY